MFTLVFRQVVPPDRRQDAVLGVPRQLLLAVEVVAVVVVVVLLLVLVTMLLTNT